jgi:signal transduction histidine kinase
MHFIIFLGTFYLVISVYAIATENSDQLVLLGNEQALGTPLIHNYTSEDFKQYMQYWAILKLSSGEMIFGTHRNLTFYNGHQWHFYNPPGNFVFSIAEGSESKIYIGGMGEIGYISIDNSGIYEYHSLKSYIPYEYLDFTNVWQTIYTRTGLYFRSPEYLFYWNGHEMIVWETETRFGILAYVHDKIFVWQENLGLFELKNGILTLTVEGSKFAHHYVRTLLPYDDNQILIGTRTDGFYLFDGISFKRWVTNGNDYIKENILYHGSIFHDGTFVFGTLHGGVVLVDRDGRVKNIINRQSGLQDQSVLYTYVDTYGMLWLGLQKGLSRIEPMLPITKFNYKTGIKDLVLSFIEHSEIFYAGTISGVYKFDPNTIVDYDHGSFKKILGISTGTRSFTISGNDLIAATDNGIYKIEDEKVTLLLHGTPNAVLTSRFNDEIIFIAEQDKIIAARYNRSNLTIVAESGRIRQPLNLAEAEEGSLYIGTRTDGVYHLKWDYQHSLENSFYLIFQNTQRINIPNGWETPEQTRVYFIDGNIRVGTYNGLYRIHEINRTLVPDSLLSENFAGGARDLHKIIQSNRGELYIRSLNDNIIAKPIDNGKYILEQGILNRIKITQFEMLFVDSYNFVWFGGAEGIYRYNPNVPNSYTRRFNTKISEMLLNNDSLIYRGPFQSINDLNLMHLSYTDNNIRFTFFIPSYDNTKENRYQTKLEPVDERWSHWTVDPFKDYNNLREGRYRFMVRGKDVYGNVSEATIIEFRVLPPWYRTWWSYGIASLLITLFLLSIHKYRLQRILEVEQTRIRIAKDLHDEIGSSLSSIALMIDMFTNKNTIRKEDKTELMSISCTTRDIVDSLRDVVWVINPEDDNLTTLIERMKSTAGKILHSIDFTFHADVSGLFEPVKMDAKRSILLIFKEALTNIIKHSGAKKVNINIYETEGMLTMIIEDDGVGFGDPLSSNGNGLQNMRYRAHQIDGILYIEGLPDQGTIIKLKMKLT